MAIRFGQYYKDIWPYRSEWGVGLELSGYPLDVPAFIDLMQSESCNPIAVRRILEDLKMYGIKKTTVMSSLDFERIGNNLAKLGVSMKIIAPAQSLNVNLDDPDLDFMALSLIKKKSIDLTKYSQPQKDEIFRRYHLALESMKKIPHELGYYK